MAVLLVLSIIGVYTTYAQLQKEESKSCTNVFRDIKPISKKPKDVSIVETFVKAFRSDVRSLAKPWEIEYGEVKVVEHEVEYRGEKLRMLAVGFPLKDGKVLAYYEFSKPVRGVKSLAYLMTVNESRIKMEAVSINGHVTTLDSCPHECSEDSDCPYYPMEECVITCCDGEIDMGCVRGCCGYTCLFACMGGPQTCAICLFVVCPTCLVLEECIKCFEWGEVCEEASWD